MTDKMKISGYTTCRNAIQMDYPFESTIRSLLDFCDEVVVADSSDGTDNTLDILQKLTDEDPRVQVYHVDLDWSVPNHGIYDGQMKAFARDQCTGDFLWQMDCDEVVEPGARQKIEDFLKKVDYLEKAPLAALPVVEFWGGPDKVRIDVNPWKMRLSRNIPALTHGIPASHRVEKNGLLYAKHGTDGCDYINSETGDSVPCIQFVTPNVEQVRRSAIVDPQAVNMYQFWFQAATEQLPTVYHFSWWSIAAKIKKYKYFWNDSWLTLYGEKSDKPKGWNPFFPDRSLDQVSDEEIMAKAVELGTQTGGHIFHSAWAGQKTNSIKLDQPIPEVIKDWADKHRDA